MPLADRGAPPSVFEGGGLDSTRPKSQRRVAAASLRIAHARHPVRRRCGLTKTRRIPKHFSRKFVFTISERNRFPPGRKNKPPPPKSGKGSSPFPLFLFPSRPRIKSSFRELSS